jgi:hypothetical protein
VKTDVKGTKMGSSDSDGAAPSRKRSRVSANSEDPGGKKARGRPRVDTQDETAADVSYMAPQFSI